MKIDDIRDQWNRTPLHYSYGMRDAQKIANILEDYGASELIMDKVWLNDFEIKFTNILSSLSIDCL